MLVLVLISSAMTPFLNMHRQRCELNFENAKALMGQQISQDQLVDQCGPPAFFKRTGDDSYGVYTNGDNLIYVQFQDNGMADISAHKYWLFD